MSSGTVAQRCILTRTARVLSPTCQAEKAIPPMPISIPPRQIRAAGDNANTGSNSRCQPAFLGTGFRKPITHTLSVAARSYDNAARCRWGPDCAALVRDYPSPPASRSSAYGHGCRSAGTAPPAAGDCRRGDRITLASTDAVADPLTAAYGTFATSNAWIDVRSRAMRTLSRHRRMTEFDPSATLARNF